MTDPRQAERERVAREWILEWFIEELNGVPGYPSGMPENLVNLLKATEAAAHKEYEWLMKELYRLGIQTETHELDLTTAEFGEMWKFAQKQLAQVQERLP